MRTFHKILLYAALIALPASAFAQMPGDIKGEFDVSNFPSVSFTYHSDNPEALSRNDFNSLKESGKEVKFKVKEVERKHPKEKQHVIILWEDMANHGQGQLNFTRKALTSFINDCELNSNSQISIYAFNRRKNAPNALKEIIGFTYDKRDLLNAIKNYKASRETYPEFPNRSDFYTAVRESIEILTDKDGVKAVIVVTAGYPMTNSGSDSEPQVLLKAQKSHVPIYIIQYYQKSGVASSTEAFAESSYGGFYSHLDSYKAANELASIYRDIRPRYYGHDYLITYDSEAERGGNPVELTINTADGTTKGQMTPPKHNFISWIKANLILAIAIVVGILLVITLFIVIIVKNRNRARKHAAELNSLQQDQIRREEEAKKREQNFIAQMEAEKRAGEQEKIKAAEQEAMERNARLMRSKNITARLVCHDANRRFNFEIVGKPITTIGRGTDNDIVFGEMTVSTHHAKIVFNGNGFDIIDTNSKNRVIVNGNFVQQGPLRNGDIVGLGKATFTFYC